MKRILIITLALILISPSVFTQDEKKKEYSVKFSGFVKNDFFFDSRQTVTAREGHFLLWPGAVNEDVNGNDINAKPNTNFLALQSRLKIAFTGPDVLGAQTSGVIEGDFFAQANDNINLFRLRHAFIKLKWTNTELITGQYWNPLFVTGCFPGTVSFNTGTPLQSFARNPQIRVTESIGDLKIIIAALTQRDYASRGINNVASSDYLRNAVIPDIHAQIHYEIKDDAAGSDMLFGIGGSYKTLVPRLSSTVNDITYQVDESVSSMAAIAFAKVSFKPVTVKLQGRYGENIPDVLSISGFAVKDVVDSTTGEQVYTPLVNISSWGEVSVNVNDFQFGIFGGFLYNLGAKEEMAAAGNGVYGLGTNIETLIRISPRVIYSINKFKFAGELEITSAAYGSDYDTFYVPETTTQVTNVRVLFSTIYTF